MSSTDLEWKETMSHTFYLALLGKPFLFFKIISSNSSHYNNYSIITIISGLCGESLGLLLGVIFKEEVESVMFGIFIGPILLMYEGKDQNLTYSEKGKNMIELLELVVNIFI